MDVDGNGLYKPLIAGIDTLEVGYCISEYRFTDEQWSMIEQAKKDAQSTPYGNSNGNVELFGCRFSVKRAGAQRHAYILANDDITIKLCKDAKGGIYYPELIVRFSSHFLWRKGWRNALDKITEWLGSFADIVEVKPSRIDLTIDFMCELPILNPGFREVVTRAKKRKGHCVDGTDAEWHSQGKELSGYTFGKGALSCRIYNKSNEILKSHKKWFKELWSTNGWTEGNTVTRVEFQCRRPFLRQMQINTIRDLMQISDVWHYLANNWLSIKQIGEDSHRERWKESEFWQSVQNATPLFGKLTGVSRLKQLRPRYDCLQRQAIGCLSSLAALAAESLSGADSRYGVKFVKKKLERILQSDEFASDVANKAAKFASMGN